MRYILLVLFNFIICANIFAQRVGTFDIELGTYRMLEYPVNIREQPNLNGRVIGQLQLHDEIEVIENMGNVQEIDGLWQNWYRIQFSDMEGYIWGGFIATNAFVIDMDSNGITDYFYSRVRYMRRGYRGSEERYIRVDDIFIYLNNVRIDCPKAFWELGASEDNYQFYRRIDFSFLEGSKRIGIVTWNGIRSFYFAMDRNGDFNEYELDFWQ